MLRAAGRGALAGLAWGLLARLFMRLIATTPEFTWGGTLSILGLSTLLGHRAGSRRGRSSGAGRSRWWRLAPVPGLVLFMSPGMMLVPGAVLVALALAVRSRVATLLLLLAAVVAVVVPAVGPRRGGGEALTRPSLARSAWRSCSWPSASSGSGSTSGGGAGRRPHRIPLRVPDLRRGCDLRPIRAARFGRRSVTGTRVRETA